MVKKVLACFLLVVFWCSCAFGEVTLYHAHRSLAGLTDGHSDYSDARFLNFYVAATDFDGSATQADVNLTGTMTFSGGSYSFWNGRNGGMLTNSGTQRTFGLAAGNWMSNIGDSIVYSPMTTSGDEIMFCIGADGGLNGVNVSWNFPDMPSYNGQGTIPNYKTTQQQLASCVPYIEFIRSGTQVTGIRWRAVNPSDTSTPAPQNYDMSFCVQTMSDKYGNTIYYSDNWPYIPANTTPEGIITFDTPIEESEIHTVWVFLNNNSDASNWATYLWLFCKPSTPEPYMYENHMFDASLVNGKADYSNARFGSLFFDIQADNVITEAHHFTADASVTIPGGGYSLGDDNTGKELGVTIPAGTDKTFKLRMYRTVAPGDTYLEYQPIYDNGANLHFSGGAETSLPGNTITWTFPAELNLSGSATISSFKSTAQQLAEGVPYVEVVSADGMVTAVNFKFVTSSDTSTALTLPYRTNVRLRFNRITPDEVEGDYYYSSWMYDTSSGTWTLGKPQPLSNMGGISVRYWSWEDPSNPVLYQWFFEAASEPAQPITITPTSLSKGVLKAKYSKTVTVSGGTAPYTWVMTSGDIPTGLTLTYSNAKFKLSGTPTESGTFKFTLTVTDKNNATVTKTFTVKITKPAISGTLSDSTVKADYSSTLKVSGGTKPYTWAKSSGTIPAGLTLIYSGDKAILSGTPTTAGTYTFKLKATDKNKAAVTKSFTVKITKPAISGTLADSTLKASYSKTLTVSGGVSPYKWSKSSGTLPDGLKLTYSDSKATISGKPTKAGTFTFKIKATDANKAAVTKSFTVNITQPEISGTLANGKLKASYSQSLTVSGGVKAYTWTVSSGELPTGLKLTYSGTKATISGTPTSSGTFTFTLNVSDANKATATQSFTVKITKPAISGTLTDSTLKASYSKTLKVSGGTKPYKWTKSSGTLPNGLKLTYSDDKAVISGKPSKTGTFTFEIKATDANKATATKSFTVNITQPEISGTLANGKLKANYSKSVTVSGGVKAYTWTVSSGELPTGLKLTYSGTKATISGTPTSSGTFTFTLKVTDANKATATQSFTVKITKPTISGTLSDGTVKTKYSATLKVSGGTASYTWVKASGTLPNGLKLTSSNTKATISGTPTKAGTFTFKIKVTDANGATKSKSFTVNIAKASTSGKESTNEKGSSSEKTTEKSQSEKNQDENQNSLPKNSPELPDGEDTDVNLYAELKVLSEDIVEAYDGKDSDLVKVKAGVPLRFTVGDWGTEVDDVAVYVDDKALGSVEVSDEGKFTLPAEVVTEDFKIGVKAKSTAGKNLESEELYIITE